MSASYIELYLTIASFGWLSTTLYDKREDFNCSIFNFQFICGNIPAPQVYGVYICQWNRYYRACVSCEYL